MSIDADANGTVTVNGRRYAAGPHQACYITSDELRADFRKALANERALRDADAAIGREIRRLTQPGVKRKAYRRDELENIIAAADRAAGRHTN